MVRSEALRTQSAKDKYGDCDVGVHICTARGDKTAGDTERRGRQETL